MKRIRRTAFGCSLAALLGVLGLAALLNPWESPSGAGRGTKDQELALARAISSELGIQPEVAFVCRLPVVGIAPCVLSDTAGNRDVTMTFTGYELSTEVAPELQAERIALAAQRASALTRGSDNTVVIFFEGNEAASVIRRYSFATRELAENEPRATASDGRTAAN